MAVRFGDGMMTEEEWIGGVTVPGGWIIGGEKGVVGDCVRAEERLYVDGGVADEGRWLSGGDWRFAVLWLGGRHRRSPMKGLAVD